MDLEEIIAGAFQRFLTKENVTTITTTTEQIVGGAGVRRCDLNPSERDAWDAGKKLQRERRARAQKRRVEQRVEMDARLKPATPVQQRIGWEILSPMTHILGELAHLKARRVARYLGSQGDDVAARAADLLHRQIVRQVRIGRSTGNDKGWPEKTLRAASDWIGSHSHIPKDVHPDDVPGEREVGEAAKWLMSVANNCCLEALREFHRHSKRQDVLEKLDTVLTNARDQDELLARWQADRKPGSVGYRFPGPGEVDRSFLGMAVAGAITARKLDPLVETLLSDEVRRSDGSIAWADHAPRIWAACGLPANWEGKNGRVFIYGLPKAKRAQIVREAVRNRMAFLPEVISQVLGMLGELEVVPVAQREMVPAVQAPSAQTRARTAARAVLEVIGQL